MGTAASRPPVLGATADMMREWMDEFLTEAARRLLDTEERDDERALLLAKASMARFLELYLRARQTVLVNKAYELGASGEQVAFAVGLRPQTVSTKWPRPRGHGAATSAGYAGWRKQA